MTIDPSVDVRYDAESYLELWRSGRLGAEERVELLEGIIVAEPAPDPPHSSATTRLRRALGTVIGGRAVIRVQEPLVLGAYSIPEPDLAVVPGVESDYDSEHPTAALLVVEVADSSLPRDRLSKARIYAAAGIGEYWVVNLRAQCVEVFRGPDPASRQYSRCQVVSRGGSLSPVAFPDGCVAVDDILPRAAVSS